MIFFQSCFHPITYLDKAESVVSQYPDSALLYLDSIHIIGKMSNTDKFKYALLKIQAKDKLFQDIMEDSLILHAPKYFLNTKDYLNASKAMYYCGRYYHEIGKSKLAIEAYVSAIDYASTCKGDSTLLPFLETNIAYLLYGESEYTEALKRFNSASEHFVNGTDTINQINIKIEIGNCYAMLHKSDSACYYYQQSLQLANNTQQIHIKSIALLNLSATYLDQGQTEKAISLYKESLALLKDKKLKAQVYLGISRAFCVANQLDSAIVYLDQAMDIGRAIDDPYFKASLYEQSATLDEKQGNYSRALEQYKRYFDEFECITQEREEKSLLDIQKKYEFERIVNRNNKLQIEHNQSIILCLMLFIALIILSGIFHYHIRNKKRLLVDAENKILQLDELASSYDEKRNSFKDILLHHFDILTKSTMIRSYLREDEIKKGEKIIKRFNEIVYKDKGLNWNMLYTIMDESHDNFITKLKSRYAELDEEEFQICCLIYATDFKNQEIGLILKASDSKITHKRSSIRRKMNIKEYSSIKDKLDEIVRGTP